ncbi:MAG: DUF4416 family protein [Planctomycetota bacterium]
MAQPAPPPPVKLICGMLASDRAVLDEGVAALEAAFGPADLVSKVYPFDQTDYYAPEMGAPLWRRFAAVAEPVSPEVLAESKCRTNALEADFARGAAPLRPINLDPGLVAPSKLVLASMKNFSHRIYLSGGVWAEVTLMYRRGRWEALPWTFPDYASGRYDAFLTRARTALREATGEHTR